MGCNCGGKSKVYEVVNASGAVVGTAKNQRDAIRLVQKNPGSRWRLKG